MRIVIDTIPHKDQIYNTVGDYCLTLDPSGEPKELHVVVSDLGDWKKEACVGIHEAIEALCMIAHGIPLIESTNFDVPFEAARDEAEKRSLFLMTFNGRQVDVDAEPGDQFDAPYYREHQIATSVERLLAVELGVQWVAYDEACVDAAISYGK